MPPTVPNRPVVGTASIRRLSSTTDGDGDGQRWSSFKFKTRTMPITTGNGPTILDLGGADTGVGTELTSTSLEQQSKGRVSMGIGAYSVGSVPQEDLFGKSV